MAIIPSHSRHNDLHPLVPALSWFYGTLDANPYPLGEAANDNDRPASVPDVNPLPQKAERYLQALPPPTRVSVVSVRRGGRQITPPRRLPHWVRPVDSEKSWGALKISDRAKRFQQTVRVNGVDEFREYTVPAGTVTHVWGARITQESGREREPENEKYISEAEASSDWFCALLDAQPGGKKGKSFKRRKMQEAIDWEQFKHVWGDVPFHVAREKCGLPPAVKCPPSLPWLPEPRRLFLGMLTGRGSRTDGAGTASMVKRPRDDVYEAGGHVIDRIALEQFAEREPDAYRLLLTAQAAGSMGALVASNDNSTGKRKFRRAAEALQNFLAA